MDMYDIQLIDNCQEGSQIIDDGNYWRTMSSSRFAVNKKTTKRISRFFKYLMFHIAFIENIPINMYGCSDALV